MHQIPQRRTEALGRRYRRRAWGGLLASVGVHLLVFVLWRAGPPAPVSPFAAAGERAGDIRPAAGGSLKAVTLRPPPPEPTVPSPSALPVPEVIVDEVELDPELDIEEIDEPVPPAPLPGTGGQTADAGVEQGTGAGDGGTADEGLFRVMPPVPRGMILPPSDRPRSVRGEEVTVWVFVDALGRVVPDSTHLDPGSGDGRFDARLREQAAQWLFEPARRGGRPVAEWYRYVIGL
jgi:hypothetical protein